MFYVYRIWDSYINDYWCSPKSKSVWLRAGNAKNAWNCARAWGKTPTFNEQDRFVIHKFDLVKVED